MMSPVVPAPRSPVDARRRQPYNEALPSTIRWVDRLPAEVRPNVLLRQFPRIANDLARNVGRPDQLQGMLDDLLVDRRGGRQGFPPAITEELLLLRDYFQGRYAQRPGRTSSLAADGL